MDSENSTLTMTPVPESEKKPTAYVSSVSFAAEDGENCVRFIVERDLGKELESFGVSYRFAGIGRDGNVAESRFFSLNYDREGLNTKEIISIRMKVPDGYDAVGCTAYVSRITYADGREEEFGYDEQTAAYCTGKGYGKASGRKKLSKGAKTAIIVASSVILAAALAVGGVFLSKYIGIMNVVNGLIDEGRYGEAYRIAEECGGITLGRTAGGNIITRCLSERDYKTAYIYSTLIGREDTVFKRVEYELANSGESALGGDALSVLKKLENDEEYDNTLKLFITKMCADGYYPAAMTAADEMRSQAEKNLLKRNLLIDGVCFYSTESGLDGMKKYDKALAYLEYYSQSEDGAELSVAREIVNRCIENGDCAGAVVLSSYFTDNCAGFDINPASVTIEPHNKSISHSLDCAYGMLTDAQKRSYHADILSVSEEAFIVRDGALSGTDEKGVVSVATYENRTAVLKNNGTVTHLTNNKHNTTSSVPPGINAVQIDVGLSHTVILKADGTVLSVGDNSYGQCNTGEWKNVVEIAAGRNFTLGLLSDGTLVACGSNKCGQCSVSGFANVASIETCDQTAVILFEDGTVALCGESSMGLKNANRFTNVEQIAAGGSTVIARFSDGTFGIADGTVVGRCGSVDDWKSDDITAFTVGSQCIAYSDGNGKMKIMGDGAPN